MLTMKNVLKLILTFIVLESVFKQTIQQQQQQQQQQLQPQPQLQAQTSGGLNQNIYQFIKSTQTLSRFGDLLDRLATMNNDRTLINLLSGQSTSQGATSSSGFTVFIPSNEAFAQNNVPRDPDQLNNDVRNFIVKDILTLERLRQMNGLNITRTYGFKPMLMTRVVKNFYSERNQETLPGAGGSFQQTNVNQQQQGQPMMPQQQPVGKRSVNENEDEELKPIIKRSRLLRQLYPNTNNQPNYPPQTTPYPGVTSYQGQTSYPGQTTYPGLSYPSGQQFPGGPTQYPGQQFPGGQSQYPGQQFPGQTQYPGQQFPGQPLFPGQMPMSNQSSSSIYDIYSQGSINRNQNYQGPRISLKLPQDELFLLNGAIILDKFELLNGIVYLIDEYPRYFDKSILGLLQQNDIAGLSQNLNTWINTATQLLRMGDESLSNALNAFGPNTYFLPTDQAFQTFTYRANLSNSSFVVDVLFKAHRVSGQILFDYYLDETAQTYYTDYMPGIYQGGASNTNMRYPVSTVHRIINGKEDIEVSIGHVKGKILPEFRNIFCASGVIHLVDTVLGIPGRNAYQEISVTSELSTLRTIIDRSPTYSQILNQMPGFQDPNSSGYTLLLPNNAALEGIKDNLLANTSLIDDFLSGHVIAGMIYTDHDDTIFQNNQVYNTLNPNIKLISTVTPSSSLITNNVGFKVQSNSMIRTTIINGNDKTSNGVIHIIDRAITSLESNDITTMIEKLSRYDTPGSPAFSQFVDVLRNTGIFNDLRQPASHFTLFIPTNEALASYQDIINSNDLNQKRNLIYRHLCKDQHLDSSYLGDMTNAGGYQTPSPQPQLTCRNVLGQDLTLTKDVSGSMAQWQGNAESKVINDFPGVYSSAYLLEKPLLNPNLPNYGLNNVNAANNLKMYSNLLKFIFIVFLL